jgi:glycosyltransferase involved in cell wall biosynthesis
MLMVGGDRAVVAGRQGAFWNTLSRLHRYWERIDVICPYVAEPAVLTAFGNVHFHPLPRNQLGVPLNVVRRGLGITRRHHPDVLVAHSYGLQRMALGALLLSRLTRTPLIVEVHHIDGYPRSSQHIDRARRAASLLYLRAASKRAQAFRVTNTAELVPVLKAAGIEEQRILPLTAVYLDRTVFRPEPAVEKDFDLIFVGRLAHNKGLPLLFDAFELIKKARPDASLLIVGTGPRESWLRQQLTRPRGRNVHHTPWVELPELAELYRRSRLVVCASSAEGGPRFVIEGMACGLPAISTPVGLMNEVIQDGVNGILLRSWSPTELSDAALHILADDDLYQQCSSNAALVGERFEASRTIEAYASSYLRIALPCES